MPEGPAQPDASSEVGAEDGLDAPVGSSACSFPTEFGLNGCPVLFDLVGKERERSRGGSGESPAAGREDARAPRRAPRNRQKLLEKLPQNETLED